MGVTQSRRVRVICRPATAPGFALAGLDAEVVRDAGEAAQALQRQSADPKVGVVLIDELLYRALPQELKARADRSASPMVAPFPAPAWDAAAAADEYILGLLRQAIGYRVRPR